MIDWDKYVKNNTEDGHQTAIFGWFAEHQKEYPEAQLLFHIPNGGERNKREATKLKGMGVKSGVPDLFLPVKRGQWPGLFIELKKIRKGKAKVTSDEQDFWIEQLLGQGYGVIVCYGFHDARDTIIKYLNYGK